jgi:hypothetical protein
MPERPGNLCAKISREGRCSPGRHSPVPRDKKENQPTTSSNAAPISICPGEVSAAEQEETGVPPVSAAVPPDSILTLNCITLRILRTGWFRYHQRYTGRSQQSGYLLPESVFPYLFQGSVSQLNRGDACLGLYPKEAGTLH